VPDLPGCHGGGESAEAAVAEVISAAREWAEHRSATGSAMPVPRPLTQIVEAGEMAVMIPVLFDCRGADRS
jgi:predicted RNase H-like HicB family nuclease